MEMFITIDSASRHDFKSIKHNIENSDAFNNIRSAMLGTDWRAKRNKCRVTIFADFNGDLANIEQVMIEEEDVDEFLIDSGVTK